jgi:rhodanese-related sulfurtransferase
MIKSITQILFLTALLLVTPSCKAPNQTNTALLTPKEVASKIASAPKTIVVDVRTPEEFAQGHIENAILINWNDSQFEQQIGKLDKSMPTVVYCAVGGRSGKAYSKLKQLGFKEVYDMKGGFDAWTNDHLPIAH